MWMAPCGLPGAQYGNKYPCNVGAGLVRAMITGLLASRLSIFEQHALRVLITLNRNKRWISLHDVC